MTGRPRKQTKRLDASRLESALSCANLILTQRCTRDQSCQCKSDIHLVFAEVVIAEFADCDTSSAFEMLGELYESLLSHGVVAGSEHEHCRLKAHTKAKKQHGKFYTPPSLAFLSVEQLLKRLVYSAETGELLTPTELLAIKIVDPAMGCGIFLGAAFRYLVARLRESVVKYGSIADDGVPLAAVSCEYAVASNCLYGVDLDPGAVRIARQSIALLCKPFDALEAGDETSNLLAILNERFRCGNSLMGVLPGAVAMTEDSQEACDRFCAIYFDGANIASRTREFFHFKFEFPEVFCGSNPGFDAVLGNPPWEIYKPNSREFFLQKDDEHYNLSKQDALAKQKILREDKDLDDEWQNYQSHLKQFSRWVSESGVYELQGSSDINMYKLFVELAFRITKKNGHVSLIVPSSMYSDKGALRLRELLVDSCEWKYLYGFHNAEGIFDIHRSFKFCIFGAKKTKPQKSDDQIYIAAQFNLKNLFSMQTPVEISLQSIKKLSPTWLAVPEVETSSDVQLLRKIAVNTYTVKEFFEQHDVRYKREFDMTNDSRLFMQRDQAEEDGYIADAHGRWTRGVDVALPLYEGRMIGQFDNAQKGWLRGKGRQALWATVPDGRLLPQYLIHEKDFAFDERALKIGFLGVGSPTNTRSMIAACLGDYPCGNSVPTLTTGDKQALLVLLACLNSFVFDWVLRLKLVGNNLNYFILQDCYLPRLEDVSPQVVNIAARLNYNSKHLSPALSQFLPGGSEATELTPEQRMKFRCVLDALVTHAYGLSLEDLSFILKQCDGADAAGQLSPKGFWRVDKDVEPSARQTVRTLHAYKELLSVGVEKFLSDNLLFCLEAGNR